MPRRRKLADYEALVGDVLDLRAFALANDRGSLTAVAEVMGESKATISRRITRLEAALGVALLRRSTKGIEVTDAGSEYRARIGEVLERLGDANSGAVNGGRAAPSGQLRVSVPPGFSSALAPIFAELCARYPAIVLVVHASSRFVDLDVEHFDVAIRATGRLADSSMIALQVGQPRCEGIFVASPSYLRKHPAPQHPRDLSSHRIVGLGTSASLTAIPLIRHDGEERIDLRLPLAVAGSDLDFLREMVLHGAGVAVLPRLNVQRDLDDGRLVHVLSSWAWPRVNLFMLHRGGPFIAPKVRAFLDFMREALDAEEEGALRSLKHPVAEPRIVRAKRTP